MIVLNETTPEVSLVSPGYPSRYPNSIHLQTEITSSVPQSNIVIEWTDFQLEAEGNCSFDRVTIAENVSRNYLTFALTMDCIRCQTLTLILFYTNESLTIFLLRLDYKYITLNKEYQDLASNNICSGRNQWSFFLILSIFPGGFGPVMGCTSYRISETFHFSWSFLSDIDRSGQSIFHLSLW